MNRVFAAVLLFILPFSGQPVSGQAQLGKGTHLGKRTQLAAGILGFNHIQGNSDFSVSGTGGTSCHPSLPSSLTVGNIVWIGFMALLQTGSTTPPPSLAIQDANSNAYTLTPSSPTTYHAQVGPPTDGYFFVYLAYFIVSGAPSPTINITWTGSYRAECWADEFHKSNGAITFVSDAANTLSVCSGTTAATPSISPGGTPGLLYSVAFDFENALVGPAAGATLGSWIGATGGLEEAQMGGDAEYDLAASGSTAVDYACGVSGDTYGAMVGAAK